MVMFYFKVVLLKKLLIRVFFCVWGRFCDVDLLLWFCKLVIGMFLWYFFCNIVEVIEEELINYFSVGVFFRR